MGPGEDEDSVTQAYADRIVIEFKKCGTRGISLLFASGDSGAARDSGGCHKTGPVFNPQWPAGSPWVTGVGATEPYRPDQSSPSETAAAGASVCPCLLLGRPAQRTGTAGVQPTVYGAACVCVCVSMNWG